MAKKAKSIFMMTKQRLEIAKAVMQGEELMLTFGFNKKPKVGFKSGKSINEDVAEGMLKGGMLVPLADGLFAGTGQTLVLSDSYKAEVENKLELVQ